MQPTDSGVSGVTPTHTNDMHHTTVVQQGPTTLGWINLGLVVIAIILATTSMLTDVWLVDHFEDDILGFSIVSDTEVGLDDITVIACWDADCETVKGDLSEMYSDCSEVLDEAGVGNASDREECARLGDWATAGLTGTLLISLSVIALLGAGALLVLKQFGRQFPFSELSPLAGGALGFVGVIVWWLLLPDAGDAKLGWSAWVAITSGALAMLAGLSPTIHRLQSPGERAPAIGARALGENESDREFVIRESYTGDSTLSLIWVNELLRVVNVERSEGETKVEDRFMTRREALSGFSHERYDWLDTYRYLWWATTGAGVILLFIAPFIGMLVLFLGALFALAQFADPEFMTLETSASRHRILLYRLGSNRELTNASMDMIDDVMKRLLSGEVLDASALNERAEQIEGSRESPSEPAAAPLVALGLTAVEPAPPALQPESAPVALGAVVDQAVAPVTEPGSEPEPEPGLPAAADSETEVEIEWNPDPEPPAEPEPVPVPEPVSDPPAVEPEPEPEPPEPEPEPEPAPEPDPEPAPEPEPVVETTPSAVQEPAQAPPAADIPPPPLPSSSSPAHPPSPPPPSSAPLPPPPPPPPGSFADDLPLPPVSRSDMPPPPPPPGADIPPPPPPPPVDPMGFSAGAPPPAPSPPPGLQPGVEPATTTPVEPGPREDTLSALDKLDLLSDLSD